MPHARGGGAKGGRLRTSARALQSASRALTSRRGDRGEIVARSWRDRGEIVMAPARGGKAGRQGSEREETEHEGAQGLQAKGGQGGQGVRECPNACVTSAHPSPPGTPGDYPWCLALVPWKVKRLLSSLANRSAR